MHHLTVTNSAGTSLRGLSRVMGSLLSNGQKKESCKLLAYEFRSTSIYHQQDYRMDILDVQIKATESCAEPSFLVVETMFKVDVKITALSALLWQDRVAAHSQTLSIPTVGNVAEISLRIPRSSIPWSSLTSTTLQALRKSSSLPIAHPPCRLQTFNPDSTSASPQLPARIELIDKADDAAGHSCRGSVLDLTQKAAEPLLTLHYLYSICEDPSRIPTDSI
ncbi:hypothetical protein EG328_010332 [Venturia inaequalis]|uniref:Uncharacterized protein n=1 Tax=Venturia inaequalis TaxID=5025 RepID=A0A8H3U7S5_VENIN|nr:hypothetical protein EG328_010332 [Venturia inaequalis]